MRKTLSASVLTLALLTLTGLVWAQSQNVQITQGPRIESVTDTTAVIAWSTNTNASTVVRYGTDKNNLGQTGQAPWGGLTHRVTLKNLQPGTTYYFDVESGQGQGTGTAALSQMQSFTTQAAGGSNNANPNNSGDNPMQATCTNQTANSFDVTWNTPAAGSSVVKFGTDANNLNQRAQAPWGEKQHKVTVKNLNPGTTYFFQVETGAEKGTGAQQTSGVMSCTTKNQ